MQIVMFWVAFLAITIPSDVTSDIDKTTIVVENGRAYLAEVDDRGTVIKRFIEVPEYFESEKSHDEKVAAAKKKYEILKKHQIDQIRFVPFDGSFDRLDEQAVANLHHIAGHYRQTYANEITVTAAKRKGNEEVLEKMINDVILVLRSLDVPEEDITIDYKYDQSDEPLQFVRIQSKLK
jgi:hypothetical protein